KPAGGSVDNLRWDALAFGCLEEAFVPLIGELSDPSMRQFIRVFLPTNQILFSLREFIGKSHHAFARLGQPSKKRDVESEIPLPIDQSQVVMDIISWG